MAYTDLKEKLEKLLSEDLSNRASLQESRRNMFLNTEGVKVQQQRIAEKEAEISSLNSLVEKKKSIVQQKDDEITSLKNQIAELTEQIKNSKQSYEAEKKELSAKLQDTGKLTELSVQNENYAAKIRELIYHIDNQNSEIEKLKAEATTSVTQVPADYEEKLLELEKLNEKISLISSSEQQLKLLVSSQNTEIESLKAKNNVLRNKADEIAAGWQRQFEQLLTDNATLQADLSLLSQENLSLQEQLSSYTNNNENIQRHYEHAVAELNALKHDWNSTLQQRDEKIMSLQSQISDLLGELSSLKENVELENEEKATLQTQLQELNNALAEKEQSLNSASSSADDEAFIEKLLSQINLLNSEKHTFETLSQEKEAHLAKANELLQNLTQIIDNQKDTISHLEQTNKNVTLAQTLMLQVKDKTAAKQAINELVREIDKCIALLSE